MDPLSLTHYTWEGPVHLQVSRSETGRWAARFWGAEIHGVREFRSLKAANEFLLRSFAAMFPEHRCTKRCGPGAQSLG